jgi:copper chaperone CopZ
MPTLTIPITGMTCANCSNAIERGLKRMKGVDSASVNLASERATVSFDGDQTNQSAILQKIDAIGYGVAIAEYELPVSGISTSKQAEDLQNSLVSLLGVVSAQYLTDARPAYVPCASTFKPVAMRYPPAKPHPLMQNAPPAKKKSPISGTCSQSGSFLPCPCSYSP